VTIRVVLADDHKIFREGLKALLVQEEGLSIVGEADNGNSAVELCLALLPDVVILDISMPDLNGIEVARRIALNAQEIRIVILSMHTDKEYVAEELRVGAMGFLSKACTSTELVNAIHGVVAGQPYLSPTISSTLVGLISSSQQDESKARDGLSWRENQVLRLLAQGLCTKEVASHLAISSKTVETYRLNLMKKLRITSMANLIRYAIREGFVDAP
jgi:DNA-binding NarL/FixJ family response regulator